MEPKKLYRSNTIDVLWCMRVMAEYLNIDPT